MMLCDVPSRDDVVLLAECLLRTWDLHYTVYYWLHYGLGGLGVLLPILATILSDLENKAVRRVITGASAVTVALYAFLSPSENMVAYKTAHAELRQQLVFFREIAKLSGTESGDIGSKGVLLAGIAEIERQILNSEKGPGKKDSNQQSQKSANGAVAPPP